MTIKSTKKRNKLSVRTFPCLMEVFSGPNKGLVVLMDKDFSGTIVKSAGFYKGSDGKHHTNWAEDQFRLFGGKITLENDQ